MSSISKPMHAIDCLQATLLRLYSLGTFLNLLCHILSIYFTVAEINTIKCSKFIEITSLSIHPFWNNVLFNLAMQYNMYVYHYLANDIHTHVKRILPQDSTVLSHTPLYERNIFRRFYISCPATADVDD